MTAAALQRIGPATRELRAAMLSELEACGGLDAALLGLRLRCACDVESLWHLRVPLMQAVSADCGEVRARQAVGRVDAVFRSFWPDAPVSAPAPLR